MIKRWRNIPHFKLYIAGALLFLPLFFLNIKNSHDWGDDFAQYIQQAHNIVEGRPQAETGYIFNEDYFLGPPTYPIGFPLLLAPVIYFFGHNFIAFNLLITFFLFLLCMAMLVFYKQYFSGITALMLTLVFCYNPYPLWLKTEVLSDIPFTFLLIICTLLYFKNKTVKHALICGILAGFMIAVRNVGVVFIAAILLDSLRNIFLLKKENLIAPLRDKIYFPAVITGAAIGVYLLLYLLFPLPSGISPYKSAFTIDGLYDTFFRHLNYNVEQLKSFFITYNNEWNFVQMITQAFMLAFLIIGIVKCITDKGFGVVELVVFLYIGAILVYPFGNAGLRFVVPVLPFFLYYIAEGIRAIRLNIKISEPRLALLIGIFILLQYKPGIANIIEKRKEIFTGPHEPESLQAFKYVRENLPEDAVIVFIKPRALALYTGRRSFSNRPGQDISEMKNKFVKFNAGYFLIHHEISDSSLKEYVETHQAEVILIWSNSKFSLYKKL